MQLCVFFLTNYSSLYCLLFYYVYRSQRRCNYKNLQLHRVCKLFAINCNNV